MSNNWVSDQVAIIPQGWIIPEENWNWGMQRKLEEWLIEELDIPVRVITRADASTYAELIVQHLASTGKNLLAEDQSIDTSTYAGSTRFRLGSGFGYSNPVREYVYLAGPFAGYILWVHYHCRCHPGHNGIAPIVVPRHSN